MSSDGRNAQDVDFFSLTIGVRKIQQASSDTMLMLFKIADELKIETDQPVLEFTPSSGSEFRSLEALETQLLQSIEFAAAVKHVAYQIEKRMPTD